VAIDNPRITIPTYAREKSNAKCGLLLNGGKICFIYRTATLPHWMRDKELDDLLELALQIQTNDIN
jgi:hypothetical protein